MPGRISDMSKLNELLPFEKEVVGTRNFICAPEMLINDILPFIDSCKEKSIVAKRSAGFG